MNMKKKSMIFWRVIEPFAKKVTLTQNMEWSNILILVKKSPLLLKIDTKMISKLLIFSMIFSLILDVIIIWYDSSQLHNKCKIRERFFKYSTRRTSAKRKRFTAKECCYASQNAPNFSIKKENVCFHFHKPMIHRSMKNTRSTTAIWFWLITKFKWNNSKVERYLCKINSLLFRSRLKNKSNH